MPARYPVFVKRDLDGFFGLFVDNLVQLLVDRAIVRDCAASAAGSSLMLSYILPGAAISILIGNVYYAVQAHFVARATGRSDVTALPFGINTPSLLIYIYFVMQPVFERTNSGETAWQAGMVACLGSGLIEFFGAFVAETVRRRTPRAALLVDAGGDRHRLHLDEVRPGNLSAAARRHASVGDYSDHVFFAVGFPLGLPGGFVAILLGTLCAWVLAALLPESLAGPAMSVERRENRLGPARAASVRTSPGCQLWNLLQESPPSAGMGRVSCR